jgi:hypothetical protein
MRLLRCAPEQSYVRGPMQLATILFSLLLLVLALISVGLIGMPGERVAT